MQNIKFLNSLFVVLLLVFSASCGKDLATIAPSDTSVSIEKIEKSGKVWNENDDNDWLVDVRVVTQDGVPVGYVLGRLTDTDGIEYISLTDSDGVGSIDTDGATFQYISITQAGIALEIESAVQSGNTIDVRLK